MANAGSMHGVMMGAVMFHAISCQKFNCKGVFCLDVRPGSIAIHLAISAINFSSTKAETQKVIESNKVSIKSI